MDRLTPAQSETIARFVQKWGKPDMSNEASRREWTRKLAETFRARFGPEWGHKSTTPSSPPSKDAIARKDGASLTAYDTQLSDGTIMLNPDPIDITGQTFLPVTSYDWTGGGPVEPEPEPQPEPEPAPDAILTRLDAILAELKAQRAAVESAVEEIKKGSDALKSGLVDALKNGLKIRF